jgi:hypothetical protein
MTSTINSSANGLLKAAAIALCLGALPATASAAAPSPMISCKTIALRAAHGGSIPKNANITPIRNGRVQALDAATNLTVTARFTAHSGKWVVARDGKRYAVANQRISRNGRRNGNLQIAGKVLPGNKILCSPRAGFSVVAADTASYTSDGSLPGGGYTEIYGTTTNVSGAKLVNYTTHEVFSNQPVSPDGATRTSTKTAADGTTTFGFQYTGAGMNDMYGVERYSPAQGGMYIDNPYYRHFITYNGSTVAAAKIPLMKPDCTVIPSPIAWRRARPECNVANY